VRVKILVKGGHPPRPRPRRGDRRLGASRGQTAWLKRGGKRALKCLAVGWWWSAANGPRTGLQNGAYLPLTTVPKVGGGVSVSIWA